MPRLSKALPKYSKHRASGQAIVTLGGKDIYLGPHGTQVSRMEYDRVVAEWLANGRSLPQKAKKNSITVVEILAAYSKHALQYYKKNGVVTNEYAQLKSVMKILRRLYGRLPAKKFGPLKLEAVQQAMTSLNWSRKHINKQVGRVVRIFAWAVSKEMIPAAIPQALREVPGLRKGRSAARESKPVLPVSDEVVAQTLLHLPPIVADMVRLQRLTGARPEEICKLRPCDLDQSGEVWTYTPESHKTEHHGKRRTIFLGPQAQSILVGYLQRAPLCHCFSPAESDTNRRKAAHLRRKTSLKYGNHPGSNRISAPARKPGQAYTTASYRRAIHRACELAFEMPRELRTAPKKVPPESRQAHIAAAAAWRDNHCWSPNQLRHSAATAIRQRFGLEAAQVILGHSAADVTQIYAERDMAKAIDVMRFIG